MKTTKLIELKKKVYFEIYNYTVVIVFTSCVEDSLINRGVKNASGCEAAFVHYNHHNEVSLIYPFKASPFMIVHECCHAIWHLMKYIGADHEDEMMAYHIAHLVREVNKFHARINLTTKKLKR